MRRLLPILLALVIVACVSPAFAQFNFGSGGTINTVGASLPACTATMITHYVIVDATSASDIAGGAAQLFDQANHVYCDQDDLVWRVLASSYSFSATPTVASVHGRTGAVVSQSGDYSVSQISNAAASSTLAGTSAAQGASLIGVRDVAGNFTAADVEAALAELVTLISSGTGATNLGTTTAPTTVTVTSDTGGDAVIPASTGLAAGVMTAADRTKLDGIAAGATVGLGSDPSACPAGQVATDQNQSGTLTCAVDDDVPESGDFAAALALEANGAISNDAVPKSAMADDSVGLAELDHTECGTGKILEDQGGAWVCIDTPVGGANLTATPAVSTVAVLSDSGTDATIPAATTSLAGVLTSADKTKLDGIAAGATVGHGDGSNCPAGQYPLGVDAAGAVQGCTVDATGGGGGATNLTDSATATTVTVLSDTGTDAVIDGATGSNAGVMVASDKSKLDGIASGATVGLGADPSACPAGQVATDQNQSGVLTCVVDDDVPESGDFAAALALEADGALSANAVALAAMADDSVGIDELDLIDGDTPVNGDCLTYDTGTGGTLEAIPCTGGADNLGNHNATQTLDLNQQDVIDIRMMGARNFFADTNDRLQAAINLCQLDGTIAGSDSQSGCHIFVPGGEIEFPSVLTMGGTSAASRMVGTQIIGMGGGVSGATVNDAGTVFKAMHSGSLIKVQACEHCGLVDIQLNGNGSDATAGNRASALLEFAPPAGAPAVGFTTENVSFVNTKGTAILGNTVNQWDTSFFRNSACYNVLKCAHIRHSQSIGIVFDGFSTSFMDAASTIYFDIEAGAIKYTDGYVGFTSDDDTGFHFAEAANNLYIDGNQIELPGRTGVKVIDADDGGSGGPVRKLAVRDNQINYTLDGNEMLDWIGMGEVLFEDNNLLDQGSPSTGLMAATIDKYAGAYELTVDWSANWYNQAGLATQPARWLPTLGAGVRYSSPTVAHEELPLPCVNGELGVDRDATTGRRTKACEAGAWVLQGDGGGGDSGRVEDGNNAGTFTALVDFDFEDSGDINFVRAAGPPDAVSAQIRADVVGAIELDEAATPTFAGVTIADRTTEPGNRFQLGDNETAFTNDPTCANSGAAGTITFIDKDETAIDDWVACDGTTEMGSFAQFPELDVAETIAANWVNTANPWADNEVADTITASSYLPLAGGTVTGEVVVQGVEIDFESGASEGYPRLAQSATPPSGDCDAAGESGRVYFDSDADTDGSVFICRGAAGWKDIDDDGGGGSSLPVVDTTSIAEGSGDASKEVRIEVDGIATATIRVITMPNADVDLGGLTAANLAAGSLTAADAAADLATQAELDSLTLPNSGQTDDRLVKTSGTTGDLEGTGISVDASNNVDGVGTLDTDGAITGTTVTADRSSTPGARFRDLEAADDEDDFRLFGNCVVTTTGAEDCDVTIDQLVDGVFKNILASVADGALTLGSDQNTSVTVTTDGTGDGEIVLPTSAIGSGEVAALDAADTTTGEFADARVSDTLTASASTTAAANDNDTSISTTAFVQQEIDDGDFLTDNCVIENDGTPIPDSCVGDGTDASGGTTAIDALGDAGAGDDIVGLAEQQQTWTWNTGVVASAFDGLVLALENDATTDVLGQDLLVLRNANAAGTIGMTERLLRIENLDTDSDVDVGLLIVSAAGLMGIAIDASDAEIGTAIALGSNDITVGGVTIGSSEFAVLDGAIDLATAEVTGVLPTGNIATTLTGKTITTATLTDPTLDLVDSAAPAPTVEGRIEWESDDDHLIVGDGVAAAEFVPAEDVSGDATMDDAGAVAVADDSHAHTTTTVSGIDVSADTNLGATAPISISGDNVTTSMATDRLLGRDTAATGVAEEITVGGGLEFTGAAGVQRSALTGDVTASAGSGATAVANVPSGATASIDETEIQLGATDLLVGRDTAAAGAAEEITVGGGIEFTGSGGIQRSALTGEVTASAGSAATVVADSLTVNLWTLGSPTFTTKINGPSVTALPGSPTTGDIVIVTNDSAIGACDAAAGSARSLCRFDGTIWQSLGDGGGGGISYAEAAAATLGGF